MKYESPIDPQTGAVNEIMGIITEISVEGSVDSERDSLGEILRKLNKHEISPAEALTQARSLHNSRQNYH